MSKEKKISMYFRLERTCLAFLGHGNDGLFYWEGCCFVFGSYP